MDQSCQTTISSACIVGHGRDVAKGLGASLCQGLNNGFCHTSLLDTDVELHELGKVDKTNGLPATPHNPKPELKSVEPLLMSATASSADLNTFECCRGCDGARSAPSCVCFLMDAAVLPNRLPVALRKMLALFTQTARGIWRPDLSTTVTRAPCARRGIDREREAEDMMITEQDRVDICSDNAYPVLLWMGNESSYTQTPDR